MISSDLHRRVEAFLFAEADLLDEWRLDAWEALLTDDARYLVPPIGVPGNDKLEPDTTLFIAMDDREMLAARVGRMMGKTAYAEQPRSNIRHMISNLRILSAEGDDVRTSANFCVYRIRRAEIVTFVGRYLHTLVKSGDSFKIKEKRACLDIDVLRGQGGLSIIL